MQEWLIYRDADHIHLITNQRIISNQELPKEIAWVIPLPSVPSEYREENDSLFQWLFRETERKSRGGVLSLNATPRAFIVHPKAYIGKYEIQPLEVIDTTSGNEINAWLYKNGYAKVSQAGLRNYLHPKHCFLAIKVKGLDGKDKTIKPLHIVYKAKVATVPLKFFANAGVFDAYVYVIRPDSQNVKGMQKSDLQSFGFRWEGASPLPDAMREKGYLANLPKGNWVIDQFLAKALNQTKDKISEWDRDPEVQF